MGRSGIVEFVSVVGIWNLGSNEGGVSTVDGHS